MGVSTGTVVKFYDSDKNLLNTYYLDDRSDDYIYQGLICDGGSTFKPDNFGEFDERQKEIMKVYFDETSGSVGEGYATVTPNIQSPAELLVIWTKIRSSVISKFNVEMDKYHDRVISDYHLFKTSIVELTLKKKSLFGNKPKYALPDTMEPLTKNEFQRKLYDIIWMMDSISKIIGLLIVAKENEMLVEITAADY